jgi:hypothetical protein
MRFIHTGFVESKMKRRQYLALSGVLSAGLAGCSQLPGGLSGPKYEDVTKEDLLLSTSDFPDGWQRDDSVNENYDAVFTNDDETSAVLVSVEIGDTVEGAEEEYSESRNRLRDPQDMDFADEAFWDTQNEQIAVCIFRDSNVLGNTVAIKQSGLEAQPDQQRAQSYAQDMYENWQSL